MNTTYTPHDIEQKHYRQWEAKGYFQPRHLDDGTSDSYCIMIPPPNVTGSLHMGHAFQDTLMDVLVRYNRMLGKKTLWQVGTDHAGIATQMVVERQLAAQQVDRKTLGREAFIDKVWEWKAQSGGMITQQLRRMGASVDWSRERFTMDEGFSNAVQEVFVRLYDEGLIYRGKRLVNWDPKLHTAVSDLEVTQEEEKGFLWNIRYPLAEGADSLIVATTRPETMLGDVAVAVNPEDPRYRHLIGQQVRLPLTDRLIPIIADDYVDLEFGTGCVKITPAHDFNDYAIGQRHQLPLIEIFTKDATINQNAPERFQGLDRFKAREQILSELTALGLLETTQDHLLKVPRGDRSGVIIEPMLTDQWYVNTKPLAEPAIKAVEEGRIEFVPKNWENTYFSWMRDIQDWCISRQLWWGHRIPAWYDENHHVYVGRSEQEVRTKYQIDDSVILTQDADVLDTWFSSALWTFGTLGWPNETPELKLFHPTDVLVTGFDIIFFWVARMIMMTLKFTEQVPFKKVYVHGLVRDQEGQKMSKSKGNVLDPIDLIDGIDLEALVTKRITGLMQPQKEKSIENATRKHFPQGIASYGTDALRFTFCSLASTGRDIKFDIGRIEGFRNFCNKIWNASRFVLMNTATFDAKATIDFSQIDLASRWILVQLKKCHAETQASLAQFRFDLASSTLYDFVWHAYCDWYLELSKTTLYDKSNSSAEEKQNNTQITQWVLLHVLEAILRLLHPMMPFITEEIWQTLHARLGLSGETIMLASYDCDHLLLQSGLQNDIDSNNTIEQEMTWLQSVIIAVRNIRGEMNISPAKAVSLIFAQGNQIDRDRAKKMEKWIVSLAKISDIRWLNLGETAPFSATQLVGPLEVLVPLAGFIDKEAESKRLNKEIEKIEKEIMRIEMKLSQSAFVDKAPKEVVELERSRLNDYGMAMNKLKAKRSEIESL